MKSHVVEPKIILSTNAGDFDPESLLEDAPARESPPRKAALQNTSLPILKLTLSIPGEPEPMVVAGFLRSIKTESEKMKVEFECLLEIALKFVSHGISIASSLYPPCDNSRIQLLGATVLNSEVSVDHTLQGEKIKIFLQEVSLWQPRNILELTFSLETIEEE